MRLRRHEAVNAEGSTARGCGPRA